MSTALAARKPDTVNTNATVKNESSSSVARKKKSWYSVLYPSYRSKCETFKKLFRDVPEGEQLLADYACALQREILAQGRLYVSQQYLCFHANILGWETRLALPWVEVTSITKEKVALVIPNAIAISTENEKYFFASFVCRDKAYVALFRAWQHALLRRPLAPQDLAAWVSSCYGEDGLDSEDAKYLQNAITKQNSDSSQDSTPNDLEGSVDDSVMALPNDDQVTVNGDSSGTSEETSGTIDQSALDNNQNTEVSSTIEWECCNPDHGKLLLEKEFEFSVEHLFNMLFTDSPFHRNLMEARGASDCVEEEWSRGEQPRRVVRYALSIAGGCRVQVTETQAMESPSLGCGFCVETRVENVGFPYAGSFAVHTHTCVTRAPGTHTRARLALYASVRFTAAVPWPLKGVMEKSTMAGLVEFSQLLEAKLDAALNERPAEQVAKIVESLYRKTEELTPEDKTQEALEQATAPSSAQREQEERSQSMQLLLTAAVLLLVLINLTLLYWNWSIADRQIMGAINKREAGTNAAQWEKLAAQVSQLAERVSQLAKAEKAVANAMKKINPELTSLSDHTDL